jgi:transposase
MGIIKDILRYSAAGLNQRETAVAAGSSLGTVNTVLTRIKQVGINDPLSLKEHELAALVYPTPRKKAGTKPEPDMVYIHAQMQRPGVTLNLLWEEYKAVHPEGLGRSQFCARYAQFRSQQEIYVRKVYKAGDQAMVDWAGMTMTYTDLRGDSHTVYFFTAILPASSLIYAEPFLDMRLEAWIQAHINAFEYFGGVPRLIIPDNLKAAVTKVNRYESTLNKSYQEMARYYRTAVLPTRVRAPRDKGPVEVLSGGERIACHLRSYDPSRRYTTCKEHMPLNHQAMADWTPQRFITWAGTIGERTEGYIRWLMEQRERPEQAFKTCTAILYLADKHRTVAMEQAAGQAVGMRVASVKAFELILKRIAAEPPLPLEHENIRGAAYYREEHHA